MKQPRPKPPLTNWLRLGYGVGAVGTGVFATIPGLLLMFYMTDTLGISAALAGLAVFLPKIWDVISDPLIGVISDRARSSWGRRRPFMLAGGLTLPLCFVLLFSAPETASPTLSFVYVLVMFTLSATAFTVFTVPYVAMPAEMTDDYHEATKLMSWRMALMTVGILAAGAVAPMLVKRGGGGLPGYRLMALGIAAVIGVAMLSAFFGTRRAPFDHPPERDEPPARWTAQVVAAFRNPHYRRLVLTHHVVAIGIGCTLANVAYIAKYLVGDRGLTPEDIVTLLFISLVLPTIIMMPPWVLISRRVGKRDAYFYAILLFAAGALPLWFAASMPLWCSCISVAVMGLGFAGCQLCSFSMLPDTIQSERALTGERRDGIFSGIWLASDKAGIAIGGLLASGVLASTGFVESRGELVAQPASALAGIAVNSSLLPATMFLLSLLVLRRYALSKTALDQLLANPPD